VESEWVLEEEKVNLDHLSASLIKTYKQCPMKYKAVYEMELPEDEPHPLTKMGSAVHKMFEMSTKARVAGDLESDPFAFKAEAVKEFGVDSNLSGLVDELTNNALRWGYFRLVGRTVGVELEFEFQLPDGTKVTGYIDRLDLLTPGADIIDLKTQKKAFEPDELTDNWQARIYNVAVRKKHPEVTGKVTVSFWVLRHHVQRVWLTSHDAAADEIRLVEMANEIRACKDPETNTSGLCQYCPYKDCQAAKMGLKKRLNRWKK
jgi:RecB family exonuclease